MTDIARELGVAASTVSRALQGHASIPEATRERVRAAAERLGYRPDPVMTALAARHWSRSERGAGASLGFLVLGAPPFRWWGAESVDEVREWLRVQRVDAVVTMTAGQALRLREAGIVGRGGLPYVCMQVLPGDPGDISGVLSNFYGVGEMALRLCDMNIRQNRLGLPADPVVVHIGSAWREGRE